MDAKSPRWRRVTPSSFPWEDDAIEFLRAGINDVDPNRAWSNFEFLSGGSISEVDVFLATCKGAYLIEIKSTPGRLTGDQQRWVFHKPDGGVTSMENPLLGANRKAKRIKSVLEKRWRNVAGANAWKRPPFIEPLVFLSDPDLTVNLPKDARQGVCGADGSAVSPEDGSPTAALPGILATVAKLGNAEANNHRFHQINTPTTAAVAKALEAVGIKESNRRRRIGNWVLQLDTVRERPGVQDFIAEHDNNPGIMRRVRIYSRQPNMSTEQAAILKNAADREFLAAERLHDLPVVRATDQTPTELGSAVIFEHDPDARRLDEWLGLHTDAPFDDRISIVRQLAETMQAVHRRGVTHRALSPDSVLVRPGHTGEPNWVTLITDFSLAARGGNGDTTSPTRVTNLATGLGLPSAATGDVALLAEAQSVCYQAPEAFSGTGANDVALDVFSFGAIAYEVFAGRPVGTTRDVVRNALVAGNGLQLSDAVPGIAHSLSELVADTTRPVVSDRIQSFADVLVYLDLAEEHTTPTTDAADSPADTPTPIAEVDPLDATNGDMLADGAVVRGRLGKGSTAVALLVEFPDGTTGDTPEGTGATNGNNNPAAQASDQRRAPATGAKASKFVYKVSLGGDADQRLAEEARILTGLRHPAVVEVFGTTELAGRQVLIEVFVGRESLADELRRNGTPGVEFQHRWGHDLLDALWYLEREGRSHRDLKPDNLGVTEVGPNREQHLVLFDFSLAGAPAEDVTAGTPPYLEPFLEDRNPPRWDLAAERYAAAVTLYEMTTGETPVWGDGQSDPRFTDGEAHLEPALFDPAVRESLNEFFTSALRRDPTKRFGNAESMLRAWQRVFDDLDATPAANATETADASAATGDDSQTPQRSVPAHINLDDPVSSLGVSPTVRSALARMDVATVRQLAALDPVLVNRTRRTSPRVRRHVIEWRAAVLHHFAQEIATDSAASSTPPAATATTRTSAPTGATGTETDTESGTDTPATGADAASGTGTATSGTGTEAGAAADVGVAARLDLDALVPLLLQPTTKGKKAATASRAVRMVLGLEPVPDAEQLDWPTQTAIADALGVTSGRVGQIVPAASRRWAEMAELVEVTDEIQALIVDNGGVMAVGELDALLVESRGSGLPVDAARGAARAVARAAIGADKHTPEEQGGNRLLAHRHGNRVLIAATAEPTSTATTAPPSEPGDDDAAHGDDQDNKATARSDDPSDDHGDDPGMAPQPLNATAAVRFAEALGERADALSGATGDVVSQERAVAQLREVPAPTGVAISDGRLVRLAAAASQATGASSALELYPVSMDPARALRLSRASLAAAQALTVEEIRRRVAVRFPLVAMPERPELDALLQDADLALAWNTDEGRFRRAATAVGELSAFTSFISRDATRHADTPLRPSQPPRTTDPAGTAVADLEARLQRARHHGGFLALRVPLRHRREARRALARFTTGDDALAFFDIEARFLAALRAEADARRVSWDKLLQADAAEPGTVDFTNLRTLTAQAAARVEADLLAAGPRLVAWNPGVLARYGQMGVIDRWRDAAGRADATVQTLWLVVFGDRTATRPSLDGEAVPVLGPSEWVDLTPGWLAGGHNAGPGRGMVSA